MSRPSSCSGVYGFTEAMASLGSFTQRKGATMVTKVPTRMVAVASKRKMMGLLSIMTAPL